MIDYINTHSPDLNIQEKLETLIENKYKYHRELTNRKYFVGPSSISLELVNIIEKKEDQNAVRRGVAGESAGAADTGLSARTSNATGAAVTGVSIQVCAGRSTDRLVSRRTKHHAA